MNEGAWARVAGWLLDNPLVAALIAAMLVVLGLITAPFDVAPSWLPRDPVAVDAIPNVGDNQQIVVTEWPGRSPKDVEDQVTWPLTTALLGTRHVRAVRSTSMFGFSSIYVIFDDEADFWDSRTRLLERLSALPPDLLPADARPTLGPDATGLGQVFWYTLEGQAPDGRVVGGWDPDELRSVQDWTVRQALQAVEGVSEVASVGGFVRELQVDADPDLLRAHGVSLGEVAAAVRGANTDVGARTLEVNGVELAIRGLGRARDLDDIGEAVVALRDGAPIRVKDVAHVGWGPADRRGALDDAGAPAVGGVVVARFGANPAAVIHGVHDALARLGPGLPTRTLEDGTTSRVTVVPFYDRGQLIAETTGTLATALHQQLLITLLVVLVMLRDLRSAVLIGVTLPLGVLATFVVMRGAEVEANLMALGGVAIAIGTMVDVGIVFVENMHQHVLDAQDRVAALRRAAAEVAPAVLTSVLTTVVGFLPVFGLPAGELRLFGPLAITKTLAMVLAFALGVLVLPSGALALLRPQDDRSLAPAAALAALGLAASWVQPSAGAVLFGLALWTAARSRLKGAAPQRGDVVVLMATVAALVVLLAGAWAPLGGGASDLANLAATAGTLALVLGGFQIFELTYPRLLRFALDHKAATMALPAMIAVFGALVGLGAGPWLSPLPAWPRASAPAAALERAFPGLGRDHMPPFDEGSFLVMPTTAPHASIGEAAALLSSLDAALAAVPEVERVVGKLGRVESALDPAPVSMFEVVVVPKPEFTVDASGARVRQWREEIRSTDDLWAALQAAANLPGLTGAPLLMPIQARMVMLQSGMRAAMGVRVQGPDLATNEAFALEVEAALRQVPALQPGSVFAERSAGRAYLEISLRRPALARYGLRVDEVQEVVRVGLGGESLGWIQDGRTRYPLRVRVPHDDRADVDAIAALNVPTPSGAQVPLAELADLHLTIGPQMIRTEDTLPTSYVLFDRRPGVDELGAVNAARAHLDHLVAAGALEVPPGVVWSFAGTFEQQVQSEARLALLVPLAGAVVLLLLYVQLRGVMPALIVGSSVVVAVGGALGLLWAYGQPWFLAVPGLPLRDLLHVGPVHLSVATWVGVIALIGLATDDGVVMATFLQQRLEEAPPTNVAEVRERTIEAGTRRVRACLMTTATTLLALLPVLTSNGRGADVMRVMALPMVGGMTVELITLFVVPTLSCAVVERAMRQT